MNKEYALIPVSTETAEHPNRAFACLIQNEDLLDEVRATLGDEDIMSASIDVHVGMLWPIYVRYSQPSYRSGGKWFRVIRRDSKGRFTK